MLKRLKYLAIPGLMLISVSLHAKDLFLCPLLLKCHHNKGCDIPAGFQQWKLNQPIKTFSTSFIKSAPTKKLTAFFFYGSVYTKFQNDATATCFYGNRNGPSLYLEKAGHYKPVLHGAFKYQWEDKGYGRYGCVAAHPSSCPYESK